ncbi:MULTISPECIES: hypothetical protein [unclassified Actinotalea]|uniref:hypothetical protein n=1 Tax=unclassified Actinotalea TaxID=2638618 RepID=UPI0015F48B49|nr:MULTISPECIES: hypothetical protein [unclassified Actinotalea]
MTTTLSDHRDAATGSASWPVTVVGTDPRTGHPGTWRIDRDAASGAFEVQWAFGHLTNPAVWMQASKVTTMTDEEHALELLRRVRH